MNTNKTENQELTVGQIIETDKFQEELQKEREEKLINKKRIYKHSK